MYVLVWRRAVARHTSPVDVLINWATVCGPSSLFHCLSICDSTASRKDGSSLTSWCDSKKINSSRGCLWFTASQFNIQAIMTAVGRIKSSTVDVSLKPTTAAEEGSKYLLPSPTLPIRDGGYMRLYGSPTESPQYWAAQNNQYELLRIQRKEGWEEGEVGRNSYYFGFSLQLSSFLEQEADGRVWRMDWALCIRRYLSIVYKWWSLKHSNVNTKSHNIP